MRAILLGFAAFLGESPFARVVSLAAAVCPALTALPLGASTEPRENSDSLPRPPAVLGCDLGAFRFSSEGVAAGLGVASLAGAFARALPALSDAVRSVLCVPVAAAAAPWPLADWSSFTAFRAVFAPDDPAEPRRLAGDAPVAVPRSVDFAALARRPLAFPGAAAPEVTGCSPPPAAVLPAVSSGFAAGKASSAAVWAFDGVPLPRVAATGEGAAGAGRPGALDELADFALAGFF